MRTLMLLFTFTAALITTNAHAHGVKVDVNMQPPSVIVKSSFSDIQPVVDASVTVYSPAAPDIAWQTGKTDKNGHFAFVPDTEGDWVFFVDDQKGHSKRATITITSEFTGSGSEAGGTLPEGAVAESPALNMAYKIIIGLSLIFGITGIFYGFRSKQSH